MDRKSMLVFAGSILILSIGSAAVFSQVPPGGGGRQQDGMTGRMAPPAGPIVIGDIEQVSDSQLVLRAIGGEQQAITLSARTVLVKEMDITSSQININDTVLVIRQQGGSPDTAAAIVSVLSAPEVNNVPPTQQGPLSGVVTQVSPLSLRTKSGETVTVQTSPATRFVKEELLQKSALEQGMRVRALAPRIGGKEEREAFKVIVIPAGGPPGGRPQAQSMQDGRTGMFSGGRRPDSSTPEPHGDMNRSALAKQYYDSPFGFRDAPLHPELYGDMNIHWAGTGPMLASWEEVERSPGSYDFSFTDRKLSRLYNQGVNPEIELRPSNPLFGSSFKEFTASGAGGGSEYPERHTAEYERFVRAFVERYDGDGVDDAPGSPVVKQYQFIHELPPQHARFTQFWRDNPEKYAELYAITYNAVTAVCPDCRVYLAGGWAEDFQISGGGGSYYQRVFDYFKKHNIRFPRLVFDYHYWNRNPQTNRNGYMQHEQIISAIRSFYRSYSYRDGDVEIVCMATGAPARTPDEEKYQAIFLLKTYPLLLAEKVRKIFWQNSKDNPEAHDIFAKTGVIRSDGTPKAAYAVLQGFIDLAGQADLNAVSRLSFSDRGVYVIRFPRKNGRGEFFVAWQDSSQQIRDVEIPLKNGHYTVRNPLTGDRSTVRVNGDRKTVRIPLGEVPVYLEEN